MSDAEREATKALSDADDVLSELKELGALGSPERPRAPSPRVEEVEVEGAEPGPALRDARGPQMVELLETALVKLDRGIEALGGLRETLEAMRDVWAGDLAETAPEAASEPAEAEEVAEDGSSEEAAEEPAQGPGTDLPLETPDKVAATAKPVSDDVPEPAPAPTETASSADPESEEYRLAREAAVRKIRGEDLTEEEQKRLEAMEAQRAEEDDVPYVGQTMAKPEGANGETTVGTLGTIKPSFPTDDGGGNSA